MNAFQDLEHALLTGVVLGTLKRAGMEVDAMLNNVEDATPYLRLKIDGIEAVVVVLPSE